ncbi:MAG: hypothetical protein LBV79_01775 [Candidatus Adiutrix sp.]|jgi:Rod binding domain-containing protein|nr:hypothetical protein [Candidatus Adiutrix sp.]
MSGMEGVGNLRQSGVRPLRSTAKARTQPGETVQRFDVNQLRNGGSMNVGGVIAGTAENGGQQSRNEAAQAPLLRGGRPAPRARHAYRSDQPVEEQVEELGKIHKSSVEYEAVLMDQLVKQMRQSPLAKTPGSDTFSDIAEQPFRDFLSQAGGLGLADDMTAQVARQQGLEQTLQAYPELMGPGWRPSIPPNLMKKSPGGLEMPPEALLQAIDGKASAAAAEEKPAPEAPEKVAETQPELLAKPDSSASPGLMSGEEIAWLYQDALDGMA